MSASERKDAPGVFLPWDSEFFGFRVGRLYARQLTPPALSTLMTWAVGEQLRCLYFMADASSAETLTLAHAGGFKFVDMRVDFALDLTHPSPTSSTNGLRPATATDLPGLEAISRVAHQDTRFFKDTNFPAHRSADLYAEWIRRDFKMNHILVATGTDAQPVGYVTCQLDATAGTGRIGLIAVAESERHRGLGRILVAGALRYFQQCQCKQALVATQASNIAAQRLYQSQGFRTIETGATFHRWF